MRTVGRNLTVEQKTHIAQLLLQDSSSGQLSKGKIKEISSSFGISRRLVSQIWSATKEKLKNGEGLVFSPPKWSKHRDSYKVYIPKFNELPLQKRTTYRRIGKAMGVGKSTVGMWFKNCQIRAHTNQIKSSLTAQNKIARLKFSLSSLTYDREVKTVKFKPMNNIVHIDEKWFYITKQCERYYLIPGGSEPHRSCQNKKFITKLMFMCAVARPQYSSSGDLLFDGKIGIFPFTKQEAAKRNSKNRIKGTMETKPIDSINKEVIKACLINQILPAIKEKWPENATRDIFIQQDNARPHIKNCDIDFRAAASFGGFNINLICQPPNSPDCNINDLGWFRALQSLQTETPASTVDDLVTNVMSSYDTLTHNTLNCVFLSLQNVMIEIMKTKGINSFKLPHMANGALTRLGRLPDNMVVEEDIIKECIEYLGQPENHFETSYDMDVEKLVTSMN